MVGAILTFLGACVLVAIYMSIVHSFLRAAEEADDAVPEERSPESNAASEHETRNARRTQWAH
jgi:hypothetical protein